MRKIEGGKEVMRKRRNMTALLLSAVLLTVTACGTGGGTTETKATQSQPAETAKTESSQTSESTAAVSQEPVTLTVWRCNMTEERTALIEELHQKYVDEHPNVTIEFTALPDSFNEKLLIAYSSGTGPDVIAHHNDVPTYIANEYIIPLDSYFEKSAKKDTYLPQILDTVRSMDQQEGKLYYLPEGCNANCLWVRSDWFQDKCGGLPVTWNEMFADIEMLTDKAAGRYGVSLRGGSGSASHLEMVMYSYSGIEKYFNEDGTCNINDPKNVAFVERWLGLYGTNSSEADIGNGWTEMAAAFQSGAAGVIQHNLGSAADHMKAFDGDTSKFEAVPFPQGESGYTVNKAPTPTGLCISSTCENPQEAFDFAVWMTTAEATSRIGEMWGQIPCDMAVLNDGWIEELPWMKMAAGMLLNENTRFYENIAYLPNYNSILKNEIEPMIQAVMAGDMTAQELCDAWAKLLEAEYQEMKDMS